MIGNNRPRWLPFGTAFRPGKTQNTAGINFRLPAVLLALAEREGFEPSIPVLPVYPLSRRAPSAGSATSPDRNTPLDVQVLPFPVNGGAEYPVQKPGAQPCCTVLGRGGRRMPPALTPARLLVQRPCHARSEKNYFISNSNSSPNFFPHRHHFFRFTRDS